MNRGKKLKQMRRFINKHGVIDKEYKRPPDKNFPPYRKGSYFASFNSEDIAMCCGHVDKYHVYKEIVNEIKDFQRRNSEENNEEDLG